ncbi:hypothetical protein, partial [Mailhella massiliensis]
RREQVTSPYRAEQATRFTGGPDFKSASSEEVSPRKSRAGISKGKRCCVASVRDYDVIFFPYKNAGHLGDREILGMREQGWKKKQALRTDEAGRKTSAEWERLFFQEGNA